MKVTRLKKYLRMRTYRVTGFFRVEGGKFQLKTITYRGLNADHPMKYGITFVEAMREVLGDKLTVYGPMLEEIK